MSGCSGTRSQHKALAEALLYKWVFWVPWRPSDPPRPFQPIASIWLILLSKLSFKEFSFSFSLQWKVTPASPELPGEVPESCPQGVSAQTSSRAVSSSIFNSCVVKRYFRIRKVVNKAKKCSHVQTIQEVIFTALARDHLCRDG